MLRFEQKPTAVSVVLKVYMHCEACAQVIKKKILKMKGTVLLPPAGVAFSLFTKSFVFDGWHSIF
jgi:copper chaperone CopZ